MRRETPFPTQKRKANESHKQSIDRQPNKGTVPDSEAYPKDADYLYLHPLEGARAPHCLVLEAGVGGYVTPRDGSTGRPWQKYSASASWSIPSLTRRAASTSSRLKYGVPNKPKTRLKGAWKQRASTAPLLTSAPCPTWEGGISGSLGRTPRRGSSIVNEAIDI